MTDEAAKQQRERACDSKMGHAVTGVGMQIFFSFICVCVCVWYVAAKADETRDPGNRQTGAGSGTTGQGKVLKDPRRSFWKHLEECMGKLLDGSRWVAERRIGK
jgi:hypothetical protein